MLQAIANLTISSIQSSRKFNLTDILSYLAWLVNFLFSLSHLVRTGTTSIILLSQILTLGNLEELISSLALTFSLKHCCMAGGLDHQEHQSPLKLYSDGYSRAQPINSLQKLVLLLIRPSLPTISYGTFGKSRKMSSMSLASHQKKCSSCSTLKRTIIMPLMGDSLSHYPKGLMPWWITIPCSTKILVSRTFSVSQGWIWSFWFCNTRILWFEACGTCTRNRSWSTF